MLEKAGEQAEVRGFVTDPRHSLAEPGTALEFQPSMLD